MCQEHAKGDFGDGLPSFSRFVVDENLREGYLRQLIVHGSVEV